MNIHLIRESFISADSPDSGLSPKGITKEIKEISIKRKID